VSLHYGAAGAQLQGCPGRAWLDALPARKRAAVLRRREPADRAATLAGVALLAHALRGRGRALDAARLRYPERGRPTLPGGPEFSIAHAAGLVACAVADAPIGLDLEALAAVRPEHLRLVLSAGERAAVVAGTLDATDAWVMKEAVLKAAGQGIDAAGAVALRGAVGVLDGREWRLTRVRLAATHVAWLAAEAELDALELVAVEDLDALPAAP
jgi:4'-phosphopantetheinyl transferase